MARSELLASLTDAQLQEVTFGLSCLSGSSARHLLPQDMRHLLTWLRAKCLAEQALRRELMHEDQLTIDDAV